MRGKRSELSAGLVAVKGTAAPAADMPPRAPDAIASRATPPAAGGAGQGREELAPLNFRVRTSFRREYKTYAASHDKKLNELLYLCFEAYKKQQGD